MSQEYNEIAVEITETGFVRLTLMERTAFRRYAPRRFTVRRRTFERALRQAKITVPWDATRTDPTMCECGHPRTRHYDTDRCVENDNGCPCIHFTQKAALSA